MTSLQLEENISDIKSHFSLQRLDLAYGFFICFGPQSDTRAPLGSCLSLIQETTHLRYFDTFFF